MKRISILSVLTLSLLLISYTGQAQENGQGSSIDESSTNKIEVIDFHSTRRCTTCNAIEANTKYTLETYFPEQMKNGEITFQAVNVDKKENFEMAEKYEAMGTALFLNVISEGKETQLNLTDFAFLKGRNQDVFSMELKEKIEEQLSKL